MGFAITHHHFTARNGVENHEVSLVHTDEQGKQQFFNVSGFGKTYESALDNFKAHFRKIYKPYMDMLLELNAIHDSLSSGRTIIPMEVEDWINLPGRASEIDKEPNMWLAQNWGVNE